MCFRYHQTRHKDVRECADDDFNGGDDADPSLATVYVVPEDPVETVVPDPDFDPDAWSPSIALMTEAGIINEVCNAYNIYSEPSIKRSITLFLFLFLIF